MLVLRFQLKVVALVELSFPPFRPLRRGCGSTKNPTAVCGSGVWEAFLLWRYTPTATLRSNSAPSSSRSVFTNLMSEGMVASSEALVNSRLRHPNPRVSAVAGSRCRAGQRDRMWSARTG